MRNLYYKSLFIIIILLIGLMGISPAFRADVSAVSLHDHEERTWIIKWHREADPAWTDLSDIIEEMPQFNAVVAKPAAHIDPERWVARWEHSPYVEYIQLNQKVRIASLPNDEFYTSQTYLQQIKMEEAWDIATESDEDELVIAIVDTGVDLTHPDLKDSLVKGVNLIHPHRTEQDDNGHGTSLAGIIGAKRNNTIGIAGMLQQAKIMPIKALDERGTGDENKLGEGIRYAVDNGAKIVLLSLGLYKYSPFMEEIVAYAEEHGVLLVAATGNDGNDVKYPAAYPSVLAVGGVNQNNSVVSLSNYGPELDVVAPWHVFTTTLNGEYGYNKGTSMAAPQVAAVAALIWSKYPHLTPHQIREHIRLTAQDLSGNGWDERSGYGLLRADQALLQPYDIAFTRGNDQRESALILPVNTMRSAYLNGEQDGHWYALQTAHDGLVTLQFTSANSDDLEKLELIHYPELDEEGVTYTDLSSPISLEVSKGFNHIQIKVSTAHELTEILHYFIQSDFQIYADDFEDNDRQYKAYVLPTHIRSVVGTFHQLNDEDWFVLNIEQTGTLRINVETDTNRIDLQLLLFRQGERITGAHYYDNFGGGQTEYSRSIDVFPGKYYVRVTNVISDPAYPVVGEYTLNVDYERKYLDPHEPNDRAFQATTTALNQLYSGVIHEGDIDWFTFTLEESSKVTIALNDIPLDRIMTMTLLSHNQQQILRHSNALGDTSLYSELILTAGTYYVRLTAQQSFEYQMYQLKITAEEVVAGYLDIKGHWAEADIITLTQAGIVRGYENHMFRPNEIITRAEAVTVIVNALNLSTSNKDIAFSDVKTSHWAYRNIAAAAASGIISGYPDGTFKPNEPTSRAEMATMLANALQLQGSEVSAPPFNDVKQSHWAASLLTAMKDEGWINGYPDGSFKPANSATRAEFVSFMTRVIQF